MVEPTRQLRACQQPREESAHFGYWAPTRSREEFVVWEGNCERNLKKLRKKEALPLDQSAADAQLCIRRYLYPTIALCGVVLASPRCRVERPSLSQVLVENTRHCMRQHYTDVPDSMHEWVWWARTLGMQSSSIRSPLVVRLFPPFVAASSDRRQNQTHMALLTTSGSVAREALPTDMLAREEPAASDQRPLSRSASSSSFEMVEAELPDEAASSISWSGDEDSPPPSPSSSRVTENSVLTRPDPNTGRDRLDHNGFTSKTPDGQGAPPSHSSPVDQATVAAEVRAMVDAAMGAAVDAAGSFVGAVVATEFTPSCDVTGCNLCPVAGECVECSGTFWLSGDKKSCAAGPITYPETPTTDCSKVTTLTCNSGVFSPKLKYGALSSLLPAEAMGTTTGCAPLGGGGYTGGYPAQKGSSNIVGFSLGSGATPWIITEAPYNTDSTNPHTFDSMWEACNPHEHCYSSSLVSTRRRRAGWGETRIDMQLICIGGQTTSYI